MLATLTKMLIYVARHFLEVTNVVLKVPKSNDKVFLGNIVKAFHSVLGTMTPGLKLGILLLLLSCWQLTTSKEGKSTKKGKKGKQVVCPS